jgi:hypothetical protein
MHCKKGYPFSRPQPGCHLPNSPWPGIIKLFPARESLVSDIAAGDGKIANLFLQCDRYDVRIWDSGRVEPKMFVFSFSRKMLQKSFTLWWKLSRKFWQNWLFRAKTCQNLKIFLMTWDFGGFSENILVFASDFREHCWKFVLEINFFRTYFSKTVSAKIFVIYEAIEIYHFRKIGKMPFSFRP